MQRTAALLVMTFLLTGLVPPVVAQTPAAQTPLPLANLVALGEERNPAIVVARQAVAAAEAAVALARVGWGVTVTASSTAATAGGGTASQTPSFSSGVGLTTSYILYNGGQTLYAVRQAGANLTAARAALDQTRQDTDLAIAQGYVGLLRAQRAVDQSQQVVVQNQELLRLAQGQFQAGAAPRSDVVSAQANLALAQSNLIAAQNGVDQSAAALNIALGLGPTTTTTVAPAPASPPVTVTQAQLLQFVDDRPEIRKALAQIEAAQAGVLLAQAGGGLTVALSGSVGQGFAPNTNTTYAVGATVSFPVSDAGRASANVAVANANLALARASIETTRLTVQQQAITALLGLSNARARFTSANAGLAFAQESLRLAQGRYAAGVATIVEVTTAQTTLVQAQVTLDSAVFDELSAVVSLRYAIGRSVVTGAI